MSTTVARIEEPCPACGLTASTGRRAGCTRCGGTGWVPVRSLGEEIAQLRAALGQVTRERDWLIAACVSQDELGGWEIGLGGSMRLHAARILRLHTGRTRAEAEELVRRTVAAEAARAGEG